jgi:hypothetical protein
VDRPRDAPAPSDHRERPPYDDGHGDGEPWLAPAAGGAEEHAVIVAALAHVIGSGRRGSAAAGSSAAAVLGQRQGTVLAFVCHLRLHLLVLATYLACSPRLRSAVFLRAISIVRLNYRLSRLAQR